MSMRAQSGRGRLNSRVESTKAGPACVVVPVYTGYTSTSSALLVQNSFVSGATTGLSDIIARCRAVKPNGSLRAVHGT